MSWDEITHDARARVLAGDALQRLGSMAPETRVFEAGLVTLYRDELARLDHAPVDVYCTHCNAVIVDDSKKCPCQDSGAERPQTPPSMQALTPSMQALTAKYPLSTPLTVDHDEVKRIQEELERRVSLAPNPAKKLGDADVSG